MAKANAVTGTTYYVAEGDPVPDELHPEVRLVGPGAPAEDTEEEPSPGSSSQTSSEKDESSAKTSDDGDLSPARTTGRRSQKDRTENSSAHSTDGARTKASE